MNNIIQKIKNLTFLLSFGLTAFFAGCKEEGRLDHIDYSAPAPVQVSNVTVRNFAGGATLRYAVPLDKNLLYVRAEYEIQPGVICECKSSKYTDSLVLEGFGNAQKYDVKVFSVGKNEKMSEPLLEQVEPLTPPVKQAKVELKEAFGGVAVTVENKFKTNLAIVLMADTADLGYQSVLQTYYTSAEKKTFIYRGLDTIPGNYSVYLRDRWSNLSDVVNETLTPLFEEYIPKRTWVHFPLPNDTHTPAEPATGFYVIEHLWDDDMTRRWYGFVTSGNFPMWCTWDMGITIKMSRLKVWHCVGDNDGRWEYTAWNIKKFELYGSMSPNLYGIWDDSWIPLGKFEIVPPSGSSTPTQEDVAYAREGFDFDLENNEFAPDPFVPVRYIRFKTLETFVGPIPNGQMGFQEISFWGTVLK
jgi:hypothetical protein